VADGVLVGDVGRHEQIQAAVAIDVQEGGAGVPARSRRRQPAARRDVGEGAVAVVAIEDEASVVGDQQVDVAVVVDVAGADALSPAAGGDPRLGSDVDERAAIVAIQVAGGGLVGWLATARAVDHEDVLSAIAVVVQDRHTAAGRLEDVILGGFLADDGGRGDARSGRDIAIVRDGGGLRHCSGSGRYHQQSDRPARTA
jgi:hypothetical protein